MPRTRTFDPAETLKIALGVFWEKGYEHTSVEDIVSATGVSRYGLYSAFGPKEELFKQALDSYARDIRSQLIEPLQGDDTDMLSIFAYFAQLRKWATSDEDGGQGCLACRTQLEAASSNPELESALDAHHLELEGLFLAALERAESKGQLAEGVNLPDAAAALAGFVQAGGSLSHLPSARPRLFALGGTLMKGITRPGLAPPHF